MSSIPLWRDRALPATATPLIVADIGGTNARFGWAEQPGAPIEHVHSLPTAHHAGPAEAMNRYMDQLPASCREAIDRNGLQAGWALAAVVSGEAIAMTNSPWRFTRQSALAQLQLSDLHLYNDFEALAHALPHLGPQELRSWDGRWPGLQGPLAVVGPGTGLGVAGMLRTGAGWQAISGEGGHMTMAAADDFEAEVLRRARSHWPHVSAERLLSGIGLPLLHDCVCGAQGLSTAPMSTEQIFADGLAQDGPARRTLEVFCAMLGSFCGNVALTLGAVGGVYIGGGLVPRLGDFFQASAFRARFEAKGRFEDYLQAIPTVVITDTMAALKGVSAAVAQQVSQPTKP